MKLYSTNDKNNIVDLREAVLNAFPKDKGLYMPSTIPTLPSDFIRDLELYSFEEIGFHVAHNLIGDEVPAADLYQLISRAINFPAPLITLDDHLSVLELWHGPTMAFKDFGARFMAELMSFFLKDEDRETTILVATSGDTGGAVAAGFHKVPGINVIILYPSGKVSELQEKQLTTWGDNISAIKVDGVFDDCQAMVKTAFLDDDLKESYNFSSANSINIARLLPQSFYYFEGYKQVTDISKPIVMSVPSGNFGNLTAGLLAMTMGLPIHKFIASTNINKTVPDYLKSGNYESRPSVQTISNAMDVGNPSNFPRMESLFGDSGSTWNKMAGKILGYHYDDVMTSRAIKTIKDKYQYLADPHGAVGYLGARSYLKENPGHQVVSLETAHPGKFKDVMVRAIGNLTLPQKLSAFMNKQGKHSKVSDYQEFKIMLLS